MEGGGKYCLEWKKDDDRTSESAREWIESLGFMISCLGCGRAQLAIAFIALVSL